MLLMSVTFAVAAVRLARRGTLVQQMSGTESLAAVDTICVDKTGTLTDGELELRSVEPANPEDPEAAHRALARFAASAGDRNRTLEAIAERFPARPEQVSAEVPFSSEWKWSGLTLDGGGPGASYVMGAPDVLVSSGSARADPRRWRPSSARRRGPGAGWSPSARPARRCPRTRRPLRRRGSRPGRWW